MNSKKKADRISQVLLYIVLFFLLGFLGTGIYFLINGFMNPVMDTRTAGFVGIGVFFFGMGLIVLLQTSMMQHPDDSFLETFSLEKTTEKTHTGKTKANKKKNQKMSVILLQFEADLSVPQVSKGKAQVLLCEDGLYLQVFRTLRQQMDLKPTVVTIPYSSITNCVREQKHFEMQCEYTYLEKVYSGLIGIDVDNPLRLKAFMDELMKHVD